MAAGGPPNFQRQFAHLGNGGMASENAVANDRFERNSQAKQQQQSQQTFARSDQDRTSPPQGEKRELSFGASREPNRQNHAQLKQDQALGATKGDGQQQAVKKELSFGADRQPNRQNHAQLKQEQASAITKREGQGRDTKKELSFGPGRGPGKGQSQGQDQGLGR